MPAAGRAPQRIVIEIFVFIVALYFAYLAFGFAMQRRMMYPAPPPPVHDALEGTGGERLWVEGDGFRSELWFLPATPGEGPAPLGPAPLVLFTHGNGELIDHWAQEFEPLRTRGAGVVLVEYPGYGRSAGATSERTITDAIVAAYDLMTRRPEVDRERIIGYGRSLGGGAVAALSRHRELAAIILESSFTSVRAMARTMGYPAALVRDPFDNEEAIGSYGGPVLVLHGRHDEIIPPAQGETLARAAADSRLEWMECGHNDCPRPWAAIESFLTERRLTDRDPTGR